MKPKSLSVILLVSTLLVGMLLGALVHAQFFDKRVKRVHRMSTPEGFVESFLDTIGPLDAELETKVRASLMKTALEVDEEFGLHREKLRQRIDEMLKEVEPMLNEEQYARLVERRERRRR